MPIFLYFSLKRAAARIPCDVLYAEVYSAVKQSAAGLQPAPVSAKQQGTAARQKE